MSNPPSPLPASAEDESQEHDEILFGGRSPRPDADEEEEGEDLLDDNAMDDYKAIPELDRYDERDLDEADYDELRPDERAGAEAVMRRRDQELARRQGRVPAALEEDEDDEDESEDDEAAAHKRRRIRDGDDDVDMAADAAVHQTDIPSAEVPYLLARTADIQDIDSLPSPIIQSLATEPVRLELKRRFTQFLHSYPPDSKVKKYTRALQEMGRDNRQSLVVSYLDMYRVTSMHTLVRWLAESPEAMLELLSEFTYDYACELWEQLPSITTEVHVRLTEWPVLDAIRDLRQLHLQQLVMVEGVVTRRTSVYPQLQQVKFNCPQCQTVIGPFLQNDMNEISVERCYNCQNTKGFTVNTQETVYRNYQRITLQEPPSTVPAGRVPRSKECVLLFDLIDSVAPGDHIQLTGVYKQSYDRQLNAQNGFPVFSTVLVANHIRNDKQLTDTKLTDDDVREILRLSKDPNIGRRIMSSIAPSIYGHANIKQAIALSMFGGSSKEFENGHRIRGDINVLVLGDPGTAKSQFLKYVEKTSHRSVYTTGKGASAVGLTASVHRDMLTREWVLEGGALVLADQGVCCIDEFDKMNDVDRTSIHEAMEQQSISISKAGIVTTLKARCAVIAAANPVTGRYNSSVPFSENVELTDAILSRFDVLCVVRDTVDRDIDERLARFVVSSHTAAHPDSQQRDSGEAEAEAASVVAASDSVYEPIDQQLLRKYLLYAKTHCFPRLDRFDDDKVADLYARLRQQSFRTGGLPISVRHMESIIRLSEAHAKLCLRSHVTADDVDVAVKVALESFISSQKFSIMRGLRTAFREYLTAGEDSFELILHQLRAMVNEQVALRRIRLSGSSQRGVGEEEDDEVDEVARLNEPVQLSVVDVVEKMKEVNISETTLQTFYDSAHFKRSGYVYDRTRKQVVKVFETSVRE